MGTRVWTANSSNISKTQHLKIHFLHLSYQLQNSQCPFFLINCLIWMVHSASKVHTKLRTRQGYSIQTRQFPSNTPGGRSPQLLTTAGRWQQGWRWEPVHVQTFRRCGQQSWGGARLAGVWTRMLTLCFSSQGPTVEFSTIYICRECHFQARELCLWCSSCCQTAPKITWVWICITSMCLWSLKITFLLCL